MKRTVFLFTLLTVLTWNRARALTTNSFVSTSPTSGGFAIVAKGKAAAIFVDTNDWPGVIRVAQDFQQDIRRVTGVTPALQKNSNQPGAGIIFIGTIGRSAVIDELARAGKLDVKGIVGRWEASVIQVVQQPFPGWESALVIAGSDKRGTIYGVYDLSEQIGVSPWHWWADVPVRHQAELFVAAGRQVLPSPVVRYRGIFINDEGPCLMTWARQKYGELNHQMYTNVFELLLRLKGNLLWPAMWDNSFATDDPLNAKLADEYGVVISTSHHEPMMRAWKEWERAGHRKGSWDYSNNDARLRAYWSDGLRRTKDYEKVITLGMRGDGDEPMSEKESVALLERIVADQRKLIGEIINPNVESVPQVWALYKEVQGYYERGMRVPDDVTLLWCDDNWGNLRRLPTDAERHRRGGAGIYYHFDYVGGPRSYKWINTTPLPKVWEQLNLARQFGADKLWLANVGDIKPLEVPLEFFLTFGSNPETWSKDRLDDYLKRWAAREFGEAHASGIADIVSKYAKYNGRRKPELLEPGTFSIANYDEADRVLADWQAITGQAERISAQLPPEARDAFFQLVLYPTKASATVNELYVAVAKNRACAKQNDPRANEFAQRARELFQQDAALADYYNHKLAGGKWNHMMDQTHIGYTNWQQPPKDLMPDVVEVPQPAAPIPAEAAKLKPELPVTPRDWSGFVEVNGYVAIEAEHFTRKTDTAKARCEVLPGHGRTLSALTVFPVNAQSTTPENSPGVAYQMWLTSTGKVEVTLIVSPCLNFDPARGVRLAVSFDSEEPQILTIVPQGYTAGDGNRDWEDSVKNSARLVKSKHTIALAGPHTLMLWMVDPAVVLQKLIIDCGGLRPSYLGPPESPRARPPSR